MLITFTAYILIPVYTLLFVAGSDWFTTNFSVLGNIAGRNEAFVLWGLMVGIYFFVCLRKIFRRMPEKPAGTWAGASGPGAPGLCRHHALSAGNVPLKGLPSHRLRLSGRCMSDPLRIPYGPKALPEGSRGIQAISLGDRNHRGRLAFLFILAGIVSSALEIFFTVSMTWMVYGLYKNMTAGDGVS